MSETDQSRYAASTLAGAKMVGGLEVIPSLSPGDVTLQIDDGNRLFMEKVGGIPGVLRVEVMGEGKKLNDCSFKLYVDPESGAREHVYDLQCEVFDRYPRTLMEVWVTDGV